MTDTRRKIDLYVLSLGLLFVFILIMTVQFPEGAVDLRHLSSWWRFLSANIFPTIIFMCLCYAVFAFFRFDFDLKGATDIPFEVTKVEGINYEHLTFLATYVIPLISFEFSSTRQLAVFALLLLVMGVIYIKTDLFYANPSLALLGFQIYRANGAFKIGNRENIILISKCKIVENQKLSYIKLDDRIYYVRGVV
ncbi:anti-phage protein KwaA [Methylotenera mobilis]|uniref:Uncharacterized protein n=1 Tax=Methylotenera mobilis (strain JLW8 / ATCC BAA-1282 / DSM 17540) TaxID=583345 RepID=C6WSP4_METML|nr:anti-phage protein KwaA [Methylotenera mobilis]ACT47136.1 conserved hypothetical protein [Methylotenera mobilis JLW8]